MRKWRLLPDFSSLQYFRQQRSSSSVLLNLYDLMFCSFVCKLTFLQPAIAVVMLRTHLSVPILPGVCGLGMMEMDSVVKEEL